MSKKTLIASESPKGREILRNFAIGLDEAGLDDDGLQQVVHRAGELQQEGKVLVQRLSLSNQYASEEVVSSYGYFSGYQPKPISEQVNRLNELFPGIGTACEAITIDSLPQNAEGWFAIPRYEWIGSGSVGALEQVFAKIEQTRGGKFYNYRAGKLGPKYLRLQERTAFMLHEIGEQQKDYRILVIPAQFGLFHRGRSVRRARTVFGGNEFGLDAYTVGIMLLTHPERLMNYEDLWVDCSGADYDLVADGAWSGAPDFSFYDGGVGFAAVQVSLAGEFYGSASGFLSQ